ncbi:MAG: hypothetical protein AAFR82_08345 [Pseudomonadota bacterium]
MQRCALAVLILFPLVGCTHFPWDYEAQKTQVTACYHGVTPDDVTACLAREQIEDPAYPLAFKPGGGAFCSPDLDYKDCRVFLESLNEPTLPSS